MNRLFLLIISLSGATMSFGQKSIADRPTDGLGKGALNVGIRGSAGYTGYLGLDGHVVPRLQYMVKDGWSVGLEGRYQTTGPPFRYAGLGPSTRYYFVRFKRLAAFGQAGVTVGQSRSRLLSAESGAIRTQKAKAWQATLGAGAQLRLSNRWAFEALIERTLTNGKGPLKDTGRWQGSAGVNYRLNQK